MSKRELAQLLSIDNEMCASALDALRTKLVGRGVVLVEQGENLTLATAPSASNYIEALQKDERSRELSKGALEVLSIIAYEAPVTGAQIEAIRGVHSQALLRQLLLKGLVERSRENEGSSFSYRPTIELVAYLGLSSLSELPEYTQHRDALLKLQTQE